MSLSMSRRRQDGQILISLVIVIPALILIVASYLTLSASTFRLSRQDQFHTQAQLAADAGADYAVGQINQDGGWSGTGGETTLHSDSDKKTTYSATVTDNSPSSKTLTVTGRTYWPASASQSTASVTIKVDLRAVSSGPYSVVGGQGGLFMSNSSKIIGGDVLINGVVSMSDSAQIGLSTSPVNVDVANQICPIPADSNYPRLCDAGENDNPITIQNTAHIYGTVRANHQSNGAGISDPGLAASSGVVPQPLPSHDRAAQKAAVATTITGASASCSGNQTRTWAANTKITGDVSVSNSCQVTVEGDVWITGKLETKNTSILKVADSAGDTKPVVMVDGQSGAQFSNSTQLFSNASSTGFQIITYWSSAGCSPDCSDVTGLDLYNSRDVVTIKLDNSAEGPQTVFYSRWTRVEVGNSGQIGAVVGQSLNLKNTATITFGTSTGSVITSWVIDGYRRSF